MQRACRQLYDGKSVIGEIEEFKRGDILGGIRREDAPSGMSVEFGGEGRADDSPKVDRDADKCQQFEPAIRRPLHIVGVFEATLEVGKGFAWAQDPCQLRGSEWVFAHPDPVPACITHAIPGVDLDMGDVVPCFQPDDPPEEAGGFIQETIPRLKFIRDIGSQ